MKEKKINTRTIQALDFIAIRLLNFKRVQFDEFCELVACKFAIPQPEILFYELVNKEAIYLCNGMAVVCNEEVLRLYCVAPVLHREQAQPVSQVLS